MDIVFAANGAYPKQWIEDENGEVSYGSVLPQAKDALAKLKSMYERNILDQNFLLRTSVNNIELITKGLCGSFFGPWLIPMLFGSHFLFRPMTMEAQAIIHKIQLTSMLL